MILQVVLLFLAFIAVIGMFGKLRWLDPRLKPKTARRCRHCKRPLVGKTCPCGGGRA